MMRFLILTAFAIFFSGCSSSPDRPDQKATDVSMAPGETAGPADPMQSAEAWLDSDAAAEHSPVLGDSPVIERIWADGAGYRALAAAQAAGNGDGAGVLLTLTVKDGVWQVTRAEEAPASVLWPGI